MNRIFESSIAGDLHGFLQFHAEAKERKLTPAQRLQLHQERSRPVMEELEKWMNAQFAERLVEPNSGLGKAITYLQRHWKGLTPVSAARGGPA